MHRVQLLKEDPKVSFFESLGCRSRPRLAFFVDYFQDQAGIRDISVSLASLPTLMTLRI